MGGDTEYGARESSAFSRNLEARSATTIGRMGPDGTEPGARLRPGSGLWVEQGITCQPPQYGAAGLRILSVSLSVSVAGDAL